MREWTTWPNFDADGTQHAINLYAPEEDETHA